MQNAPPGEHVEPGMPPFRKQPDHILRDLAFRTEHPEHHMPVRNRLDHFPAEPLPKLKHPLMMAGGAKMAALA